MKYINLLIYFCSTITFAQTVTESHYKTGELAVRQTVEEAYRNYGSTIYEEKVEVFNRKGELVYTGSRRNYAGHSSVNLTFHENGGVKTIKASSAPDAGIQWYRSEYQLDEDGNVISKKIDSHDNRVTIPLITNPHFPERITLEEIKKQNPEPLKENQCASPMQTIVYLTNKTKKKIEFLVVEKNYSNKTTLHTLKPNASIKIGEYINAETFKKASSLYEIKIKTGKQTYEPISLQQIPSIIDTQNQVKTYKLFWVGE